MSKAGLTILLAFLLFITSGVFTTTFAQEKLLTLTSGNVQNDSTCNTPLQNFMAVNNSNCENKSSLNVDPVAKVQSQTPPPTLNDFSYSTEPEKYVPTPTIAPVETIVPSIIPNPIDQTPQDNFPSDGANLNADLIFNMINAHRAEIGKPAFQKDPALCQLAQARSVELHDELFVNHNLHSGLYNRHLPYWVTENAKYGSNEAGTVNWWLHSPIHRAAIEGNDIYSCGACKGTQCSELFTSYTPKG